MIQRSMKRICASVVSLSLVGSMIAVAPSRASAQVFNDPAASSSKPGGERLTISAPAPQTKISLYDHDHLSTAAEMVRDAGIGLGIGGMTGFGFVMMTQGKIPSDHPQFDNEALISGLVAGVIGGAILGFFRSKIAQEKRQQERATLGLSF